MGTPEFAVPTLTALHEASYCIPLVVTQPDRPKGRGRQLTASPVKIAAQTLGLDVYQPHSIRSQEAVSRLQSTAPDFMVVVAYGQILPRAVLQIPALGPINLHASLLPKYRGPAPIQWAMMRCESETGVTTMLMDQGVDTGDILLSATHPISGHDTAATLHHALARLGAGLMVATLQQRSRGNLLPRSQDHSKATFAPMLKKSDGKINWHLPAGQLDAFIRAMTPWPGAFCFLEQKRFKICKAQPLPQPTDATPGLVVPGFPDELCVATGQGVLSIQEIQGASGKAMAVKDFLRGHRISPLMCFS